MIHDSDEDLTFANKTLVDTIDRAKDTTQGFSTSGDGVLFDDVTIVQRRLPIGSP